jgi:two-component system response regulator EvgA
MVLLDLAMPGMDGLEVIGRLAVWGRRPRVIMMTAHVDEDYRRVAAAAGADGFLVKADLWTDLLPLIDALRSPRGGEE